MCSRVAYYTTEQAVETLAKAAQPADNAKEIMYPTAFARAVGANGYDPNGNRGIWRSACTRCGGKGVVYWGTCFRCGGHRPSQHEVEVCALMPILRDLVAIAAGREAPSIVADRKREQRANEKHRAAMAAGLAWLKVEFPSLVVETNGKVEERPGMWHGIMGIAMKAAAGAVLTDAQRACLVREAERHEAAA